MFLLLQTFYKQVKKSALILFVYFYQFYSFRRFTDFFHDNRITYRLFFIVRVMKFTKNPYVLFLVRAIWPEAIHILERRIVYLLLPYLIIFDLWVNAGVITKFYMVLPWFYLYTIIKTGWKSFLSLNISPNRKTTISLYGFKRKPYKEFIYTIK